MFTIKLFLSIIPIVIIAIAMYKIDIEKEPKKVLKQMFLDWANGTGEYDFGGNCNRLSDVSLYSREKNLLGKEKEESTRNLNNGLDINLVISDGHKKDNEEITSTTLHSKFLDSIPEEYMDEFFTSDKKF